MVFILSASFHLPVSQIHESFKKSLILSKKFHIHSLDLSLNSFNSFFHFSILSFIQGLSSFSFILSSIFLTSFSISFFCSGLTEFDSNKSPNSSSHLSQVYQGAIVSFSGFFQKDVQSEFFIQFK